MNKVKPDNLELDRLYRYNRQVANAEIKWNREKCRIHAEQQHSIAEAYAKSNDAYLRDGWDRWEPVHKSLMTLNEAIASGEGIPHASGEYYTALAAFDLERRGDSIKAYEQIVEELASAGELAKEALQRGYAEYVDALQKACDCDDGRKSEKKAKVK